MRLLKCIHKCICAAPAADGVPLVCVGSFSEAVGVNHLIREVGIQHTLEQCVCTPHLLPLCWQHLLFDRLIL